MIAPEEPEEPEVVCRHCGAEDAHYSEHCRELDKGGGSWATLYDEEEPPRFV
jgi:hypothetical protein